MRSFLTVLLILILIAALAAAGISVYKAWKIIHPEKVGIEPFSSNVVPEYRNVSFNSKDGNVKLSGWFFEVKGSGKTVILAHSYGKNRLQFEENTLNIIKGFVSRGYNVLAFDLRNSGESGGTVTSMGLYEKYDVLGAIDYAKTQGTRDIVLMGFSTGASASILAAAENKDVDAVIADSPYSELKTYLDENLSVWSGLPELLFNKTITYAMQMLGGMDVEKSNPRKAIINISPRSVFIIHGTDDKIIPVENSKLLYSVYSKSMSKTHEFWETDAGHLESFIKYPQQYMDRVLGFLDRVYENK